MQTQKAKSLTALASYLDTRKLPLPAKAEGDGLSMSQRKMLASVVRPEAEAKAPVTVSHARHRERLQPDARRHYPRAGLQVRAQLSLVDDPSRSFEATLPTINLSVGGLFLQSSFFLKLGTKLLLTLQLPDCGREVKVKGEVVRIESRAEEASGFALRFTEYLEDSRVILATHFLSPMLHGFLTDYAEEHGFEPTPEYLAHSADVLSAWELRKAELGGDIWALSLGQR